MRVRLLTRAMPRADKAVVALQASKQWEILTAGTTLERRLQRGKICSEEGDTLLKKRPHGLCRPGSVLKLVS